MIAIGRNLVHCAHTLEKTLKIIVVTYPHTCTIHANSLARTQTLHDLLVCVQDKENYALLITELREAINAEARSTGQPAILLSLAVPAGESKIDAGFDVAPLAAAADWFGVMAYDLHGSWERVTGAHSALYSASASDTLTASYAMKAWETRGVPASKLVMGMAAYGRGWTLYSASSHGMGAQAKGASTAGT